MGACPLVSLLADPLGTMYTLSYLHSIMGKYLTTGRTLYRHGWSFIAVVLVLLVTF